MGLRTRRKVVFMYRFRVTCSFKGGCWLMQAGHDWQVHTHTHTENQLHCCSYTFSLPPQKSPILQFRSLLCGLQVRSFEKKLSCFHTKKTTLRVILVYILSMMVCRGGRGGGHNWQFIMAGQLIRRWVRGLLCMRALTFCYTYAHSKDNAHPSLMKGRQQDEGCITKCRLYWCLIEFIDRRYRQSCWYFRPLF